MKSKIYLILSLVFVWGSVQVYAQCNVTVNVTNYNGCAGTRTLAATTNATGVTGHRWYTAQTGGSLVSGVSQQSPASPVWISSLTTNFTTNTSYWVAPVCGSTEGPRTKVSFTLSPGISITPSYSPISFCQGSTLTASGGSNYQWSLGTSSTDPSPTILGTATTITPSASGYYILKGTNSCGVLQTTYIEIFYIPNVAAFISPPGPGPVRIKYNGLLTASPVSPGYYYNWKKDGTQMSTTSSTYTVTEGGVYTVSISNGACAAGPTSQPVTIAINRLPTAGISPSVFAVTLPNNSITIPGIASDPDGSVVSTVWTQSSGPNIATLSGANTLLLNVSNLVLGTYTFTLTVTDDTGESATATVTVNVAYPPNNYNWIKETVVQAPNYTTDTQVAASTISQKQKIETWQYFDGLGRPIQIVNTQASPLLTDIVVPIAYDALGRETIKYLPYASGNTGGYKDNFLPASHANYATASNAQYKFYQNTDKVSIDAKPYAETRFEPSPLNRVLEQGAPGTTWQPDAADSYTSTGRTIKKAREFNLASEVLLWTYTYPTATYQLGLVNAGTISTPVYYAANQLYKNKTKDEQHHEVIEYIDHEGRTVLKRVQVSITNNASTTDARKDTNWASTYYIYDDFGNLVCVIPPEAVRQITESGSAAYLDQTDAVKDAFLKRWAFRYVYDSRKRMTQKQVPGAEAVYMVYDNRDRLVLTQDGNQRTSFLWTFTKYDELNRPIVTGIKDTTAAFTPADMQLGVNNHYAKAWAKYGDTYIGVADKNVHGYSNFSYPTVTTAKTVDPNRYLTVTYYDNYTFKNQYGIGYDYVNDDLKETVNGYLYEQPDDEFASVIGQVTGTKVKVLDGGIAGGVAGGYTWLKSVNYYDDKYRVIQTVSDNYKGGTDRVSNLYDFVGKVLQSKGLHVESDVQWTDLVLNTVIGNYLQKTGSSGWTSGAASVQSLPAGQDGWMEFVASEENTARMVGLSTVNNGVSYTTIDYAIHPRTNKTVAVYEKGSPTEIGTYASGDVFRIERVGTTIKYYKNGFVKHTSTVPSTGPLLVDVSLNTAGSTALGVKTSFSTSSHTILRRYVYDHSGRLKQIFHTLDNGPEVLLASNEYNELGQLIDKGLHSVNGSVPMQSVDYRYNIRGWLTSMNNAQLNNDGLTNDDTGDFFGMNLAYNEELGTGNTQTIFTNTGLVSSYTFNGNASDAGENGLNGTIYGAQLTTDSQGNSNSAYTFTASDYIDIPNSKDKHSFIQNTGKFTISAFVKIDDLNGRNVIVSSTGTSASKGFTLMYETYGGIYGNHQLRFSTTFGQSGSVFIALGGVRTIDDNNWHHVAAIGDGEYVTLYVDGVQDGSPTRMTTFTTGSATSTTLIGKTRSNTNTLSLGMVGAIDELNIFNRPLSKTEIAALANRTPFNTTLDESQYNGNISAMKWSVNQGLGDTKEMAYNFKYDPLNRLVSADNLQSSSLGAWDNGKYHERDLTYDLNGNIKSLTRSSELGMIDNLVYDYGSGSTQSNKLLSVADRTTDATIKSKGFIDANTTGNDYNYDVNGNMTVDLNKGLSSPITYNYLNLPEVVTRTGNTIRYIYDATGRKLSQVVRAGFGIKQTDYAGEFVYEDDMLRFINHEEGRIVMSSEKLLYKHNGETLEGMTALNSTLSVITVNGEKYVNATSSGTGSGILPIGNAINVVPGEKYLIRIKGYRSNYNAGIMIRRNNTTISYGSYLPALVSNEAWMEQIYVVPPNTSILEIGVGWPVPTGTAGLNVNAFELIKLERTAPEYQYNLKDHLGNVRLTFTTKQDIDSSTATLEDENLEEEEGKFLRYDNARIVNHYLFDRTKGSKPTQIDGGAQRLSGRTNEVYGLAKSLSVMPGDVINMEVYAKYIDPTESNRTAALNTLIMQIAAGTASGGIVIDGGSYAASTSSFPYPADATQNTSSSNEAGPKAFLSWLVYDRNYKFIPSKSGFRQMSSDAKEDGSDVAHELLSGTVTITEPGYIYVFLSNEQGTDPYEVYFDDFNVEHTKSPVIQSEEYYPFGLAFNNYQRENSVDQKYFYNGKELQDELNLGWMDYGSRMYMPEIGRFNRPDIFSRTSESCSVYSYAGNDPINFIDMGGNFKFSAEFRSIYPRVTAWLEQVLPLLQNNQHIINTIDNHTHLGRNVIKKDFQNGNGPTLSPQTPFDSDAWGTTVDIGDIRINQKNLIDLLERGLANDPEYKDFTDLHKFMTIATVLHELIHEGSRRTGFSRPVGYHPDNRDQDAGDNWEIEAFGRMVDRIYKTGGRSDNPRTKDSAESFREDNPVFFYLFINTTPSGNGESKKKKKPDADREAKKRSG